MVVDILFGLLDHTRVMAAGLAISKCQGAGQNLMRLFAKLLNRFDVRQDDLNRIQLRDNLINVPTQFIHQFGCGQNDIHKDVILDQVRLERSFTQRLEIGIERIRQNPL